MKDAEFKGLVKKAWRVRSPSSDKWLSLKAKLNSCRGLLKNWARRSASKGDLDIKKVEEDLQRVQMEGDSENSATEKALKNSLHKLLEIEDLKWRQRARENWLKFGDRNTKYFHACASQRKSRNSIREVTDLDGNRWSSQ